MGMMRSFSSEVREELGEQLPAARHCRLAQLRAIWLAQEGRLEGAELRLRREPAAADRIFFTILEKTFKIDASQMGGVLRGDPRALESIVSALEAPTGDRSCCRRSFLRGVFLCGGSVSDPAKSYHLEVVLRSAVLAEEVLAHMRREGLHAHRTRRSDREVVYLKDGEEIVQLLGFMEAGRALLRMENERVVRDVRGNVNRRVNLETANIGKAVDAAARQIGAIAWIQAQERVEELPPSLREMARARLRFPEATLEELGAELHPPVGKSGVNHRLRRLVALAKEMGYREEM